MPEWSINIFIDCRRMFWIHFCTVYQCCTLANDVRFVKITRKTKEQRVCCLVETMLPSHEIRNRQEFFYPWIRTGGRKEINAHFSRVRVHGIFSLKPVHVLFSYSPPLVTISVTCSPLERGPEPYNNIDPDESGVGVSRRFCRRRLGYTGWCVSILDGNKTKAFFHFVRPVARRRRPFSPFNSKRFGSRVCLGRRPLCL